MSPQKNSQFRYIRTLREFKDDKLIEIQGSTITILDLDELKEMYN